jgi:phytoene synthase
MSGAAAAAESRASHFFVAFRVLAPERRRAIRAVYGVCRQADDDVDRARDPGSARAALAAVVRRLDRAFSGGGGPADEELRRAIRGFALPRRPFDDLIEGVSWDLEHRRYADTEELRGYCARVASTVGLLCVRIFGCADGRCEAYARELGIALQWTNILRDIRSDLERDRVYLPQSALSRHGLSEADLGDPAADARARLAALIREEAAYARSCYRAAELALPADERARMLSGRIMAGVYGDLLRRIERAGAGVLERSIRVPALRRYWIAARLAALRRVPRV